MVHDLVKAAVALLGVLWLAAAPASAQQDERRWNAVAERSGLRTLRQAAEDGNEAERGHVEIVIGWYTALDEGRWDDAHAFLDPHVIQHAADIETGADAWIEALQADERDPFDGVHRVIAEGPLVFVQRLVNGEERAVRVDIVRIDDDGRIAEHWSLAEPVASETLSGRSVWDDAEDYAGRFPTSNAQEQFNTDVVFAFMNLAFGEEAFDEAVQRHAAPALIQHDPNLPDGAHAFVAYYGGIKSPAVVYDLVLHAAQNDLVAFYSRVHIQGEEHAVFDLFRVRDARVVEQWAVRAPTVPLSEIPHVNGQF